MSSSDDSTRIVMPVLAVNQPIGTFYVGVIPARELFALARTDVRRLSEEAKLRAAAGDPFADYIGIQRPLDPTRVEEIKQYVHTVDASFPNSIILALDSNDVIVDDKRMSIAKRPDVATVIDGQHRLAGFEDGPDVPFDLVVTIFLDMDIEQQAYLFTTINTKQTKINPSLAQDLLEFSTIETPEKVAHNMAKEFNTQRHSPWYLMIKMLGRKDELADGIITQRAFAKEIVDLTYDSGKFHNPVRSALKTSNGKRSHLHSLIDPDPARYPFWELYSSSRDDAIFKILWNFFSAFRDTFAKEWGNREFIISKTTGYRALMLGLRSLVRLGVDEGTLDYGFFGKAAERAKQNLDHTKMKLTAINFGPGEAGSRRLFSVLFPGQV